MRELHHRPEWHIPVTQLTAPPFELRLAEASDEPFLFQLYAHTHGQQFTLLPLPPKELDALLRMQCNAQRIELPATVSRITGVCDCGGWADGGTLVAG